jgi:glycosyltransferase involved in cell wall biosynthesis
MITQTAEISNNILLSKRNRLELAHLCQILGKNPWTCHANSAYHSLNEPSVTVLITLFNYSQYIVECLDSVCASIGLEQKLEVLVIDDCSTDNSAYIVEQYIHEQVTPICLVKKLFNTGLSDPRNVGLQLARAPYVFVLDADNWIYPNCLLTHYENIKQNDCAAVYGIISKFNHDNGEGLGLLSWYDWNIKQLLRGPYIDTMAMFRKDIVINLGGYSIDLIHGWEDYDLWLKIAQAKYHCKFIPQILSSYRVHPSSMISHTNRNLETISCYLYKKFFTLLEPYLEELDMYFGAAVFKDSEKGIFRILESVAIPEQIQQEQIKLQEVFLREQLVQKESQLQIAYAQLEELRIQVDDIQSQLKQSRETIQAMKTSKFWKFRKIWFKLKRFLGLPVIE